MRFDDFRLFEDEWSQPPLEEPSPPPVVQVPPPVVAQAALPAFSGMIRERDPDVIAVHFTQGEFRRAAIGLGWSGAYPLEPTGEITYTSTFRGEEQIDVEVPVMRATAEFRAWALANGVESWFRDLGWMAGEQYMIARGQLVASQSWRPSGFDRVMGTIVDVAAPLIIGAGITAAVAPVVAAAELPAAVSQVATRAATSTIFAAATDRPIDAEKILTGAVIGTARSEAFSAFESILAPAAPAAPVFVPLEELEAPAAPAAPQLEPVELPQLYEPATAYYEPPAWAAPTEPTAPPEVAQPSDVAPPIPVFDVEPPQLEPVTQPEQLEPMELPQLYEPATAYYEAPTFEEARAMDDFTYVESPPYEPAPPPPEVTQWEPTPVQEWDVAPPPPAWLGEDVAYTDLPPYEYGMPQAPEAPIPTVTYAPPAPTSSEWSVEQVIRTVTGAADSAIKLVRAWETRKLPPNPVARATDAQGRTVLAKGDGMVYTRTPDGRVTSSRPAVGLPQATVDGFVVVNNGDGTFTRITPAGARETLRYAAAAPGAAGAGAGVGLLVVAGIAAFALMG